MRDTDATRQAGQRPIVAVKRQSLRELVAMCGSVVVASAFYTSGPEDEHIGWTVRVGHERGIDATRCESKAEAIRVLQARADTFCEAIHGYVQAWGLHKPDAFAETAHLDRPRTRSERKGWCADCGGRHWFYARKLCQPCWQAHKAAGTLDRFPRVIRADRGADTFAQDYRELAGQRLDDQAIAERLGIRIESLRRRVSRARQYGLLPYVRPRRKR